ncbi:hypothetical protein WJ22_27545 [Burkholderia vietnamiensis]|nr:hypothetical protein A8H33_10990 [Burkholderia vietnamiensis]KVF82090.1 hypothetical protein WJ19_26955 [Burkholderia vietnamiensis]KVF87194.1 hypothetical protein WJ20_22105 [Burkholderia vietnamiensis]KVF96108.1 hypothetical protein WJ22_27545 [Burkholderia vietnamiensis]KVM47827.1 hypothetical protein WJ57_20165 [Burkholderia vietnamiensis]
MCHIKNTLPRMAGWECQGASLSLTDLGNIQSALPRLAPRDQGLRPANEQVDYRCAIENPQCIFSDVVKVNALLRLPGSSFCLFGGLYNFIRCDDN